MQKPKISGSISPGFDVFHSTCARFPPVTPGFRNAARDGPVSQSAFAKNSAATRVLWGIELQQTTTPAAPKDIVKLAFWNLERCKYLDASAARLASVDADIQLLCELDAGMARSGQHHTAQALAAQLGQGYAFGVEYVELGLGDAVERKQHQGQENRQGLHGNAILANGLLKKPALVRLDADGHWFLHAEHERRLGGRIAVLATVVVAGVDIVLVCTHFESGGTPATRADEMRKLLTAIDDYCGADGPVIIAGDLNTNTAARSDIADPEKRAALLADDPDRLADPVTYEPLFELAAGAGFGWQSCNPPGTTQRPHTAPRFERKLDWFFTRGLGASRPTLVSATSPQGQDLSDHDMITVEITPEAAP